MKPTSHFLFAAATTACLFTSITSRAEPKDDLAAVMKAQSDAPAFRAKVVTAGNGMYSDGQKTLMKQGEGAFQEAPPQMAAMLTQNSQEAMMQQAMQAAKNVKVSGHEPINGNPATVYSYDADMGGMQSSNKLWVSDKDHRPVKSESDVHGSVAAGAAGNTDISMKVTSTFEYDPSIKVVMPAK